MTVVECERCKKKFEYKGTCADYDYAVVRGNLFPAEPHVLGYGSIRIVSQIGHAILLCRECLIAFLKSALVEIESHEFNSPFIEEE